MNSCILMAEVTQDPQLRYLPGDAQTAIAEMVVQFPPLRAEDPLQSLNVVGWGAFAQEIQERYHQGDRLVIEGRLRMSTVERDGVKEKRVELIASRIYPITAGAPGLSVPGSFEAPSSFAAPAPSSFSTPAPSPVSAPMPSVPAAPMPEPPDYDEIPF